MSCLSSITKSMTRANRSYTYIPDKIKECINQQLLTVPDAFPLAIFLKPENSKSSTEDFDFSFPVIYNSKEYDYDSIVEDITQDASVEFSGGELQYIRKVKPVGYWRIKDNWTALGIKRNGHILFEKYGYSDNDRWWYVGEREEEALSVEKELRRLISISNDKNLHTLKLLNTDPYSNRIIRDKLIKVPGFPYHGFSKDLSNLYISEIQRGYDRGSPSLLTYCSHSETSTSLLTFDPISKKLVSSSLTSVYPASDLRSFISLFTMKNLDSYISFSSSPQTLLSPPLQISFRATSTHLYLLHAPGILSIFTLPPPRTGTKPCLPLLHSSHLIPGFLEGHHLPWLCCALPCCPSSAGLVLSPSLPSCCFSFASFLVVKIGNKLELYQLGDVDKAGDSTSAKSSVWCL